MNSEAARLIRHVSPTAVVKTLNAILVFAVAFASVGAAQARPPVRTTGPGYDGAIVERGAHPGGRNSVNAALGWTPTENDVREAEKLLPTYLVSPEAALKLRHTRIASQLGRYKRQYWGERNGSRRLIRLLFYHEETPVVQKGAWLRTAVSVSGGGDRYFRVTYEMDRKRFTNLWVNTPE